MTCITLAAVAYVAINEQTTDLEQVGYAAISVWVTSLLLGLHKLRCAAGADWSIFNPPASWQRREVAQLYGNNDMQTGRPNFSKMVGALLIYPLYVVQVSLIHVSLS